MGHYSSSSKRFSIISEVISRRPRRFDHPTDDQGRRLQISDFYGAQVFDARKMRDKLPKDVNKKMQETILAGKRLDEELANVVAHAVKEWAMSEGATHFCHWFHPQTGATAEKHDSFLNLDDNGEAIERFSGSQLIQSEPDASSFPSGGRRTTFEARGYTAWDPSSPMFLMDSPNGRTLCIPSAFISYTGEALDEKTGLLRSMELLSEKSVGLLEAIGEKGVTRVVATLGLEQEYFLIDRAFYQARPDLLMSGRTLQGAQPPKGQQLEDQYFGSIPSRVMSFMHEVETELYKLGVPVKTRHNEVAPSQFELAPIFENANIATDHNQICMEMLQKVAHRHNMQVLLHEKPFAELNGSGKHMNWSMSIVDGPNGVENLLEPGPTPEKNLRFLVMLTAILRGVHRHAGLLRAAITSAGNDHRLGANEAPPAIISAFLGEALTGILDRIEKGKDQVDSVRNAVLELGVDQLPKIKKDNTDRNRTSPFAFTGNKFEFRAVGSSASPALPATVLNAVVAEAMEEMSAEIRAALKTAKDHESAILEVLQKSVAFTKTIRFEGNNYSEDWVKEAAKRGLLNLRKTPESLAQIITDQSKKLLTGYKIFSENELSSRFHVRIEGYVKKLLIEVSTFHQIVENMILPAAYAYHGDLSGQIASAKAAGVKAPQSVTLSKLTELVEAVQQKL